jgi:urease subunit beta
MSDKTHPKPRKAGANRSRHSGPGRPSQEYRPSTGGQQNTIRPDNDREALIPGEVRCLDDPVVINAGKDVTKLKVTNTADRPIQVGSHYHFAEANPGLAFDRTAAWGRRLNVLAGGSVRFEPGAVEEVELIPIGGKRIVAGLRGECGGKLDDRD